MEKCWSCGYERITVKFNVVSMIYLSGDLMDDEMLSFLGLRDVNDLFEDIPEEIRSPLDLPEPMDEAVLLRHLMGLSSLNAVPGEILSFLGGGVYHHHIPPAVDEIASRAEFLTSYTPYQPEMSQGLLQATFEYQSMISRLYGMEVVNASLYDGATAMGEAIRMAVRVTGESVVHISEALPSWKMQVVRNYTEPAGIELIEHPLKEDGTTDLSSVDGILCLESPNYFGIIEDLSHAREVSDFLIVGANPISLALFPSPGDHDADIAFGEGQPLGIPPSFGGPLLGILASKMKYVRQMPGRLIGMTVDAEGRRAFAMTLQTREQHIRRHRATSNICSNHALNAIRAAVYLALRGHDLPRIARTCMKNREILESFFRDVGLEIIYEGRRFNEFVAHVPDGDQFMEEMVKRGILPGIPLADMGMKDAILVATTEIHDRKDLERYGRALREVI